MIGSKWVAAGLLMQGVIAGPLSAVQFGGGRAQVRVSETAFDKSNFGQLTVIAARNKAEESLRTYLMLIQKAAALTPEQRNKLELAGRIDIHRFFSDYASAKRTVTFGLLTSEELQQTFLQMQQAVQPMATRYEAGLYDESSLLAKTLVTTLGPDQREKLSDLFEERKRTQYEHQIRLTLAMIDHKLPLTQKERITITTLLLTKTDPPTPAPSPKRLVFPVLRQMASIEQELLELFTSDEEAAVIRELIQVGNEAEVKP
jgi:hypothetical protein